MKKFLMCYPHNFLVNYEINPWMRDKIGSVDTGIALSQWQELHKQLLSTGNQVELMTNQTRDVPDLVFTANAAIKSNGCALISHFANPERQPESVMYQDFFQTIGYKTDMSCVEQGVAFEGAGDMLVHQSSNTHILAYGFRTDKKALGLVETFLHAHDPLAKVFQVELVDSRFYHLDTCYCPLDNGDILYFPDAFSASSQELLQSLFPDRLISVAESDAQNFACNAVCVDKFIYMNKASPLLLKILLDKGFIVVETPLTEFLKSGGSAKCLTMEL